MNQTLFFQYHSLADKATTFREATVNMQTMNINVDSVNRQVTRRCENAVKSSGSVIINTIKFT